MRIAGLPFFAGFCLVAFSLFLQGSEPALPPASAPVAPAKVAAPGSLPAGILCFAGGEERSSRVGANESKAEWVFWVTNISSQEITVISALASCGCTTAKIPSSPWTLAPGASGPVEVTMNTQGKKGTVTKPVTLLTDRGTKVLQVGVTIVETAGTNGVADREQNQMLARADRQAIFKGECVRCHVTPTAGKYGRELYAAACGICHESTHRAAMVPDLNLRPAATPEYWRQWIKHGRPGSLMPAFAVTEGGPLTDVQVEGLVDYLTHSQSKDRADAGSRHHSVEGSAYGTETR
jgi:mono/diheme cytochrome c family protein